MSIYSIVLCSLCALCIERAETREQPCIYIESKAGISLVA